MDVGMSNSVTTAIRGSVRQMAIGKTKTTEKADRATVEQVKNNALAYLMIFLHFCFFFFRFELKYNAYYVWGNYCLL